MSRNAPLRILHVVSHFPPDRIGGVGEVVAHLHRALAQAGHDSRVLTTGTDRGEPDVHRVAATPDGFPVRSLAGLRRARASQVVHFHHGEALGLLAGLRLIPGRPPILTTFHVSPAAVARSSRPFEAQGRAFGASGEGYLRRAVTPTVREAMDRVALRLSDRCAFISRSTAADVLGAQGAASARIVFNGLPDLPPAPPGAQSPESADLLYVGTASTRKRVALLPLVLEEVRRAKPDAILRIVGFDLEGHRELSRSFAERDLAGAVRAEGVKRSDELPAFYRASKVLLVPSAYEGLPMVIMEAFRCGLPCVATRVSGHPEIVDDGDNGFLCPLDDPGAMGKLAVRILADDSLRARMSRAAARTVRERFGLRRQLDGYLELYHELTGPGRAAR